MPTIKGTASVTDDHAILKQLKKTKFPKSFSQNVNLNKINIPVLSQWTDDKITSILGFEDEIVQSTAINLFFPNSDESNTSSSSSNKTKIDPKRAQLNLVGFLGVEEAASFSKELWEMMVDAQTSPHGIPRKLLDKKKEELEAEVNNATATAASSKQQKHERPPEMDEWAKEASRRAEHARQVLYGQEQQQQNNGDADQQQQHPRPVSPPHYNEIDTKNVSPPHKQSHHHHHHRRSNKNNEIKSSSSRWDRNNNDNNRSRSRSRSITPPPPERQRRRHSNNSSDDNYDNNSYSSSSSVDDKRRYREEEYRRSKKKSKKKKKKRSSRSRERSRRDY